MNQAAAGLALRSLRTEIEVLRQRLLECIGACGGDLTSDEVLAQSKRLDEAILLFQVMTLATRQGAEAWRELGSRKGKESPACPGRATMVS